MYLPSIYLPMSVDRLLALAAKPVLLAQNFGPALRVSIGVLLWMYLLIPFWFPRLLPGFVRLVSVAYAKLVRFLVEGCKDYSDTSIESKFAAEVQRLDQTVDEALARIAWSLESGNPRFEEAVERVLDAVAALNTLVGSSPASGNPTTAAAVIGPSATIVVAAESSSAVGALAAATDSNADDDGGKDGNVIVPTPSAAERALTQLSPSHQLHGTRYFSNDGFVPIQAFLDRHPSTANGKRMKFACLIATDMTTLKKNYLVVKLHVQVDTYIRMMVPRRSNLDWNELEEAMGTETCYLVDGVVRGQISPGVPAVKFDNHSWLRKLNPHGGCCLEQISIFYDKMDADYNARHN